MMIKSRAQTVDLLAWMEALADPTRLRLLRLLERNELTVNDLCQILQLPQSNVSRHLKILADQRWVYSHAQGTTRLYRMVLDELSPGQRQLWLLARKQTDDWATLAQDQLRLRQRLKQRPADAQSFFASSANQWDAMRTQLYGQAFISAALAAMLPGDYVLADLGCGSGSTSQLLAPHLKQVFAVDNSPAMLKSARSRLADFDNVEVIRAELSELPIADDSCDAALLALVLSYCEDPSSVLRQMSRILKPGGKAVVVDLLPHDRDDFRRELGQASMGLSGDGITALLANCGFNKVNVTSLPPEPAAKGPALFLATGAK